jgi:hypothetical protein
MENALPLIALKNFLNVLMTDTPEAGNVWVGLIVISVIVYILALIFSKKSSCIIICGWKDILLVVAPIVIIAFILLYNGLYGKNNGKTISANNVLANVLFVLPIIATFAVSIITNLRYSSMPQSVFFIILSLIAKAIIMMAIIVFVILILGAWRRGKEDKRYKSGYRPGKNDRFIAIIGLIATFLIGSLIKNPVDIDGVLLDSSRGLIGSKDTFNPSHLGGPASFIIGFLGSLAFIIGLLAGMHYLLR